jgi:hypothetical protein
MATKTPKKRGEHKFKRRTVQFPPDWFALAQEMASESKTPVMWLFIELIRERALNLGKIDLPIAPWEGKTK